MRSVIVMLACAACGRVGFGAFAGDAGGASDDDGSGPGSGSDLSNTCLSPGYGDGFDEASPCKALGMPILTNGSLSTANSTLTISPDANAQTTVGCMRASASFGAAGAFVEISQVVPAPGHTALFLTIGARTLSMATQPPFLVYSDSSGGTVTKGYDPLAMRWWRIRPDPTTSGAIAETSADGRQWTMFATTSIPPATTATLAVFVQTESTNATPGTATIEGIDVCPPS
ncbi:MAG: hypothetical protein ABI467_15215 [Kofleriaceae bacterium]